MRNNPGVSVSLRYKKPVSIPMSAVIKRYNKHKGFVTVEGDDMKRAHPPRLPREGERLIAIDPGRRDVVFGSVYGSDETVHLSMGQLCHDSGRRWSKRKSDKVFTAAQYGNTTLADAKARKEEQQDIVMGRLEILPHIHRCCNLPWMYGRRKTFVSAPEGLDSILVLLCPPRRG